MNLARNLAISTTVAIVVVVMAFLTWSVNNAHEQIAEVSQSQQAVERLAKNQVEARDRVIMLPEDGNVYHTSVFVRSDWRRRPQDRSLLAWFGSNQRLQSLKAQTHFHIYTERSPLWRGRYSRTVPRMPCVRVQVADGRVIYQSSADNLPKSASKLANDVSVTLARWPFRPRPRPCPRPDPAPDPDVDVDVDVNPVQVIPDIAKPDKEDSSFPWGLLAIVVVIAGVVPIVIHFKKAFRG